jgi:hypothetical protein
MPSTLLHGQFQFSSTVRTGCHLVQDTSTFSNRALTTRLQDGADQSTPIHISTKRMALPLTLGLFQRIPVVAVQPWMSNSADAGSLTRLFTPVLPHHPARVDLSMRLVIPTFKCYSSAVVAVHRRDVLLASKLSMVDGSNPPVDAFSPADLQRE